MEFINIIDYIGTFAFAISGIRLAAAKNFDWFGAYVVGFVTAVGGGTLRDLMLDVTPFWMEHVSYMVITGLALVFVLIFRKYVVRLDNTFFIFDAVGIALFTVVGVEKSIAAGFPMWVNVIMGTITGAAGGMFRDIFIKDIICNGAGRAMYFNGIPEKNIAGIRIENCRIVSEKGADIRYSDGVELRNVHIMQSEGRGYTVANCRNVLLEGCSDASGDAPDVFQYKNKNLILR